MMEWILIMWIYGNYPLIEQVTFNDQQSCLEAQKAIEQEEAVRIRIMYHVCVPKGTPRKED